MCDNKGHLENRIEKLELIHEKQLKGIDYNAYYEEKIKNLENDNNDLQIKN